MTPFRVLGEVQVVGPTGILPLGGLRQRLLLAVLLANANDAVTLGQLSDAVWPDGQFPADPEKTLRIYVTRLRKVLADAGLPPSVLLTRDNGYLLSADRKTYDAAAFQDLLESARRLDQPLETAALSLERALAFWDGSAFGDVGGDHALLAEAQRLDELRLVATEDLLSVRLALGHGALVVAELESLVARFPLRERLRRLMMDALSRCGRHAEATRVFEDYRRLLRTELGLEPSPEMSFAHAALLNGSSEANADPEPVIRNVRGYKLFERIGEGCFSVVYRARQPGVGRDVAIKIIRSELANRPYFIGRFEAEAQLVARLEHPNIVPLYDFWREPSCAYLVMRWLRAGSLESHLDRGPWSLERTVRMLGDIGSALATAHRSGVIHRDVRPANILLDEDGNAYLSDFGIAIDPSDVTESFTEPSAGSPAYAPPEQLRGGEIGTQGDVYSLAITAFEALAGRLPFDDVKDAPTLLRRRLTDPIPLLSSLRPELPVGIDTVMAIATAKSPIDRYQSVEEFVVAMNSLLSLGLHATPKPSDEKRNPYRGLLAFQEADASVFFGREHLVSELVAHLGGPGSPARFLAVVGPSGCGKSSVVRAGLIPALRRGEVVGSDRWFVVDFVPGSDPFKQLAAALQRVTVEQVDIASLLATDSNSILTAARKALPDDDRDLLLVIDQFEEMFTSCDPVTSERFLDCLAAAVNHNDSRLRVVLTLRSDYLDHVLRYQTFAALLKAGMVMATPLSTAELEQAVVAPAGQSGVMFENALVTEMVAAVANRDAALPLLQFTLHELYERRLGPTLTIDRYRELGGVSGALAERAERLAHSAGPEGLETTRRLFNRLLTLTGGDGVSRRRTLRSELPLEMEPIIEHLGAARLLSFDRDPTTRSPTVEIGHEALLQQWPRLAGWISEDREGLRVLREIADAAFSWDARLRDPSDLYRGGRLEDALAWQCTHSHDLNERESAFLAAGRAERDTAKAAEVERFNMERRTNRRLRRLLATVTAVAFLAFATGESPSIKEGKPPETPRSQPLRRRRPSLRIQGRRPVAWAWRHRRVHERVLNSRCSLLPRRIGAVQAPRLSGPCNEPLPGPETF